MNNLAVLGMIRPARCSYTQSALTLLPKINKPAVLGMIRPARCSNTQPTLTLLPKHILIIVALDSQTEPYVPSIFFGEHNFLSLE